MGAVSELLLEDVGTGLGDEVEDDAKFTGSGLSRSSNEEDELADAEVTRLIAAASDFPSDLSLTFSPPFERLADPC